MSPPQLARVTAISREAVEPPEPFMTDCHRNALERLRLAFDNGLPLAILIGEGRAGTSFVIRHFLERIQSDDVAVARLTRPCGDADSGMREIIRAIGFQPKDMNHNDLEKIFTMFLSYQRTHHCRTVICIEETQESGSWMLDKIRRLVEMEIAGRYGLMVILSGQPDLNQRLGEPPLNAIRSHTRERVYLAPLSASECREYVQRRVEAGGTKDITQVFDYDAIGRIYELSAGVTDAVSDLCSRCLEMRDTEQHPTITAKLVEAAAAELNLFDSREADELEEVESKPELPNRKEGRFVARINGELVQEIDMLRGHLLIGRDAMCDICINHPTVSRYHALVVNSQRGVMIVDLGSTNGTFVNNRKVRQFSLSDNDTLSIGKSRILYTAASCDPEIDAERTDYFESHDAELKVLGNERLGEIDSLGLAPANSPTRH
jgi:type II secretory pathway predicted ATPase ExeA